MSFAGHVLDMINRIEQNRRLLKAPHERIREVRDAYREAGAIKYKAGKPYHKKISEKEKQKIRQKIIRSRRKERWKDASVLFISTVIACAILYLLYYLLSMSGIFQFI